MFEVSVDAFSFQNFVMMETLDTMAYFNQPKNYHEASLNKLIKDTQRRERQKQRKIKHVHIGKNQRHTKYLQQKEFCNKTQCMVFVLHID